MRRAVLLYNPNAGRARTTRLADLNRAAEVLRDNNIAPELLPTEGPGTAGHQAADAARRGAELIFACGGDGTLHDIIQGVAQNLAVSVGIIPLGSGNVLARHLGLSFNPPAAVRQLLDFTPRSIPLGRVTCETAAGPRSRYFAVIAGAGPDGMLVYGMLAAGKHRLGRSIYYLRAARLFLSSRFSTFRVGATLQNGIQIQRDAVSAMAIRVGDLGGLFSPLAHGASPTDETLKLALTAPPFHLALPAWFATSWTRTSRWNPYTHHLPVSSFSCTASGDDRVHVQADGEWIGTLPMQVDLMPNALRLLMPA